jgi:hypothetical protein
LSGSRRCPFAGRPIPFWDWGVAALETTVLQCDMHRKAIGGHSHG